MARNFYSAKHYTWTRNKDGGLVHCEENGQPLFCVYDDGQDDMLINAYMQGRQHGEQIGRAELQNEIRLILGLHPPTAANAE